MPRESNERPSPTPPTAAALRAMATRSRRLAAGTLDQRTIATLIAFAEELEAAALEPPTLGKD
jgi:hypothetical protein